MKVPDLKPTKAWKGKTHTATCTHIPTVLKAVTLPCAEDEMHVHKCDQHSVRSLIQLLHFLQDTKDAVW